MVAARRLRKSVVNDLGEIDLSKYKKDDYKSNYKNINKDTYSIKNKILFKCFFSSLILFMFIICKLFFLNELLLNKTCSNIYNHLKFDFAKYHTLENMEEFLQNNIKTINYIIPNNLSEYIKEKYIYNLKPYILKFNLLDIFNRDNNLKSNNIGIYSENKIYEKDDKIINSTGKGGGGEEKQNKINSDTDKLNDIEYFNSKNLKLVKPTTGVITSPFGEREEIFKGVNSYHTGIDIANKENTIIVSTSSGIVESVVQGNKYYGNYVEIKNNDVLFKYAHLNEVKIKKGDLIDCGDTIGYMGSTGLSTGPHLHFEIKVRNNKIDPQLVMDF